MPEFLKDKRFWGMVVTTALTVLVEVGNLVFGWGLSVGEVVAYLAPPIVVILVFMFTGAWIEKERIAAVDEWQRGYKAGIEEAESVRV